MRFRPHTTTLGLAMALLAGGLCLDGHLGGRCCAADAPATGDEYDVKAAFLFNLAKFVEWPQEKLKADDSPFVIGVVGQEAVEHVRTVVRDKAIDKHKIVVRLLDGADELKDCHILFLARSDKQRAAEMMAAAQKAPILTVGETEDFLDAGGMIRFYLENDNLRIEISSSSVRQASLVIKANALAVLVKKGIVRMKED